MIDFCVSKHISFATKLYMFSIFADKIDFTQSAEYYNKAITMIMVH